MNEYIFIQNIAQAFPLGMLGKGRAGRNFSRWKKNILFLENMHE